MTALSLPRDSFSRTNSPFSFTDQFLSPLLVFTVWLLICAWKGNSVSRLHLLRKYIGFNDRQLCCPSTNRLKEFFIVWDLWNPKIWISSTPALHHNISFPRAFWNLENLWVSFVIWLKVKGGEELLHQMHTISAWLPHHETFNNLSLNWQYFQEVSGSDTVNHAHTLWKWATYVCAMFQYY